MLEEVRAFFRLSLAAQLAEVDQAEADLRRAGFTDKDLADMWQTLIRIIGRWTNATETGQK